MRTGILAICLLLSTSLILFGQTQESISTDTTKKKVDFIFSLGGGVARFMGDVQDASKKANVHLLGNRAVFGFHFGAAVSKSFVVSTNMFYGKLSGNENTYGLHRNFESNMVLAGLVAEYNFAGLYKNRLPVLNPFINAGLYYGSYWNISTDLSSSNGTEYHYWSDGTIKDEEETGVELIDREANNISRDYEYESRLVDGALHTFNVSAGFGLDLHLSRAVTMRLMSRYFFAVNDKLDGHYQGDASGLNDGFFYNSLSLVFNAMAFSPNRKDEKPNYRYLIDLSKLNEVENEDSDGDGVVDMQDRCAATPSGIEVDMEGCPLDTDVDGIPDYRDKQKNSAEGAIVDRSGVEVDYKLVAKQWEDTSGLYRIEWNKGYVTGESPLDNGYTVNVKTVKKGSEKLLSPSVGEIQELRKKVINDSLILFTLGVYEHFDEAELRSRQLNAIGENQAYGVAEYKSEDVATDLLDLDATTGDSNMQDRSYGLRNGLNNIKQSEAYKTAELAYSVSRLEKHLDESVPEYLLVKDFLRNTLAYEWDPIVKKNRESVQSKLDEMPVSEKPKIVDSDQRVTKAENPSSENMGLGRDTSNLAPSNAATVKTEKTESRSAMPAKEPKITVAPVKPQFEKADLDNNGFISSTEIEQILEDILEGRSTLTVAQFNDMVQYYTYYTGNADPIDFGGTEVVIVDGVLTILKKEGEGFKDESRRILARKYKEVDFNQDGDLTPDEVQKMINLFMEEKSTYSAERIYELIDLFFD